MIELKVNPDRMNGVKVGVLRKVQTDVNALFAFIAHFMVDDSGRYMERDAAFEVLDELTLADLQDAAGQLTALAMDTAAPKATAG